MSETIANWVTAAAAVAAAGLAYWAGHTAKNLYDVEAGRDRSQELARQQEQARLVAAWVSWTDVPRKALRVSGHSPLRAHLALRNASAVPVYDVTVEFSADGRSLGQQAIGVQSPTGEEPHHRRIEPETVGAYAVEELKRRERLDIRAAITFTDASGIRWHRAGDGALTRQ